MIWVLLQRSRYGNAMTPLRFLFIFIYFSVLGVFFKEIG